MLQEQSRLFQRLLFFADVLLIMAGWSLAYVIRFEWLTPPAAVSFSSYLRLLPWVLLLSAGVFWFSGLYAPDRTQRLPMLVYTVAKAVGLGLLLVAASLSFYRTFSFSRLHMAFFGLITPALMIVLRLSLYAALRRARQQGRSIRRVLIVGAGRAGRKLEAAFDDYAWMGFDVIGLLDDFKPGVLGSVDEAGEVMDRLEREGRPVDYVYIALPLSAAERTEKIVGELSTRLAHICLVPDLFHFNILNSRITDVDGLPVIHLVDEAPPELRRFVKRVVDVAFSLVFLLLTMPLMLLIALAVKASSPGPVFYRQERMGLNGQRFNILKFRTMPIEAETATGPVWAKPSERRATRVGRLLRRTSLDELPQFFNVLRGDMSVVGPRPERPVFIDEFKTKVPHYMLRHKVKAGITGWAQVNGWRGNTSIEKRIEYDLYYIRNWSLAFDLKIMVLTLWRGFIHENAY